MSAALTLADYERLNPRCELEHQGVPIVYATPNQHDVRIRPRPRAQAKTMPAGPAAQFKF